MLSLPPSVRIFICTEPADMRRSFDGLARMVEEFLGDDPLSGHLFVFKNKRGDRVKILYWDGDGPAIWYKRLEEGTFRFPDPREAAVKSRAGSHGVEVRASEMAMLLDGIDPTRVQRRRRYQRPASGAASRS